MLPLLEDWAEVDFCSEVLLTDACSLKVEHLPPDYN